ncbi:DNA repair exonuclease [Pullulanibacillus sp. KACC 23026]|uniref:metallophosphoesterase family protein n=1 Tax=Pullulanibacillus sp. KACC 23026 TaxID=3028315 RepID=UPI0023B1EF07|nr:DNA repair exonuclease [Pullulanibacillus sp. KACC 23026]WEG12041.1 DNA repair exonuclease [Pullulanibacillus sp. KACC 23026]
MTIRFIHAADFHLDRPYRGLTPLPNALYSQIIEAPFHALHQTITYAIENEVDFILISGDLYDSHNPSLRAEQRFKKEIERLRHLDISVYVIHGNHDPLDSVRLDVSNDQVEVFSDKVEVKRFIKEGKQTVNLYGFSYPTRHVTDSMISLYKKESGADYHIGLLHGSVKGTIEHDNYAPFTVQELIEKDFDYWALGHIHKRERLTDHAPIYYSGTPQGLSVKETGDKGVQLVTLSKRECKVDFLSTASFLFETMTIDITEMLTLNDVILEVESRKSLFKETGISGLFRLKVIGQSPLHHTLRTIEVQKELLDLFQDGEDQEEVFCWIMEMDCDTLPDYPRDDWGKESHFLGDLIRLIDDTDTLTPFVEELYTHSKARSYLDPIDAKQQESILKAAEQLIVRKLYDEGKGR